MKDVDNKDYFKMSLIKLRVFHYHYERNTKNTNMFSFISEISQESVVYVIF